MFGSMTANFFPLLFLLPLVSPQTCDFDFFSSAEVEERSLGSLSDLSLENKTVVYQVEEDDLPVGPARSIQNITLVDVEIWFNVSIKINGMNDLSTDPFISLSDLNAHNSVVVITWRVEIETNSPREKFVRFESWNFNGGNLCLNIESVVTSTPPSVDPSGIHTLVDFYEIHVEESLLSGTVDLELDILGGLPLVLVGMNFENFVVSDISMLDVNVFGDVKSYLTTSAFHGLSFQNWEASGDSVISFNISNTVNVFSLDSNPIGGVWGISFVDFNLGGAAGLHSDLHLDAYVGGNWNQPNATIKGISWTGPVGFLNWIGGGLRVEPQITGGMADVELLDFSPDITDSRIDSVQFSVEGSLAFGAGQVVQFQVVSSGEG
jgi:hypothetical protein